MNNTERQPIQHGRGELRLHLTEKDVQSLFSSQDAPTPVISRIKRKFNVFSWPYGKQEEKKNVKISLRLWFNTMLVSVSPAFGFAQNYTREFFFHDLAAGLSVGLASIPMGMSYALLAGFSPVHGLYTDFIYPLIYTFFGGQPQICVGTSAIEAIMTGEALDKLLPAGASLQQRIDEGTRLALLVGLILIVMRIFGLGLIAHFLAYPVLSGFSTGSAIVIGTSQLKFITGMRIPAEIRSSVHTWYYIISHWKNIQWVSVAISMSHTSHFIVGVIKVFFHYHLGKSYNSLLLVWFPVALFGLLIVILVQQMNALWFRKYPIPCAFFIMTFNIPLGFLISSTNVFKVDLIGSIAQGFPRFHFPRWEFNNFYALLKQAMGYSIFYFVIHITIGKTVAQQQSVTLDSNREMFACGICSLIGSVFQCYPVATSLSRTSIATASGAMTPFYSLINAAIVGLALSSATGMLSYLPKASLSALVLTGVYRMIFIEDAVNFFFVSHPDFFLWLVCCSVVVWRGALEGVTVAVAASIIWLLKKDAFPAVVELGRLPNTKIYRDIRRFPMALIVPHCRILRFDASLHFANSDRLEHFIYHSCGSRKSSLEKCTKPLERSENQTCIHTVIIDASSINDMDITAVRMLKTVAMELNKNNILLLFANWKGPMRDFLERSEFYLTVKPDHCFLSLHDAVIWSQNAKHFQSDDNGNDHLVLMQEETESNKEPPQPSFKCLTNQNHEEFLSNSTDWSIKNNCFNTTPCSTQHQVRFITESAGSRSRNWPVVVQRTGSNIFL